MTETEKIILSDVYVNKTPFSLELKKELRKIAVKGKYNLFLYQHLGDDFFRLNIKKLFEEKFGELHFIIQPGEVFLMDFLGVPSQNYTIFDYKSFLKSILPAESSDYVIREYTYSRIVENTIISVPQTYEPFICDFNNFCNRKEYEDINGTITDIFSLIKASFNIQSNKKIDLTNIHYPTISESLQHKLNNLGVNLDKTVLILPEARSDALLKKEFWQALTKEINKKGFIVIENIINEKNHVEGCLNLNTSLEELCAIAINCHSVFSIRNGLCDILVNLGKKLHVFWTKERSECSGKLFDFKSIYQLENDEYPSEVIVEQGQVCNIIFDGENIGKNIPDDYLPPKLNKRKNYREFITKLKIEGGRRYSKKIIKKIKKENCQLKINTLVCNFKKIIKGILHIK